ncbi:uncharacterized protein TRAVEDRAFT_31052 [Trametes versicolor FP-101664 SS1]|uniref:uncharacterized protein n=1 Tax=Trametes versicolor (strain FP-101664) TaxID=717944 RepID=UPI0004622CB6|nr:uncharacterized protein TRAVEDRAFT_31052 [Trametes versicolor FP-101664 SS1]EIW55268.1 hypothetical protein TRAVEDRAFT_31052 [Trametes versicolor FP-101664 SS1]
MRPREHARTTSRSTAPFEIAAPHLPCCTGYEPDSRPPSRIGAEAYRHPCSMELRRGSRRLHLAAATPSNEAGGRP